MDISALVPPASALPGPSLTGSQSLDKEDFLRMLVTQLNNQDPLNPLEGHEFAAQLAQFSSVEQLVGLNASLAGQGEMFTQLAEVMGASLAAQADLLGTLQESLNRSAASGLIGKVVEGAGNQVSWQGGEPVPLAFRLEAPADTLTVVVRDAAGNVVRTLAAGSGQAGRQEVAWDGMDAEGQPLPPGSYTFAVQAADASGNPVNATTLTQGIVERVSFGPDGVLVWVNGTGIPLADVVSIGTAGAPPVPSGVFSSSST